MPSPRLKRITRDEQGTMKDKSCRAALRIFIVYCDPYDKDSTNGTGSTQYLQEQLFETLWVASELGGGPATLTQHFPPQPVTPSLPLHTPLVPQHLRLVLLLTKTSRILRPPISAPSPHTTHTPTPLPVHGKNVKARIKKPTGSKIKILESRCLPP